MKKAAIASLALIAGGMVYVLWRGESLLMFSWFETLGLSCTITKLRGFVTPYSQSFPHWFYYCLPQALWFFSGLLFLRCIWHGDSSREGTIWFAVFFAIGFAFEGGQFFGIVPGHFDVNDAALLMVAAMGTAIIAGFRWQKKKGYQYEA